MFYLQTRNANDAYPSVIRELKMNGIEQDSRNGKVLSLPYPACIEYMYPEECIVTIPQRDSNPIFSLMEALWMLEGRNDLKFLSFFNKNMEKYSDDGVTLTGSAYGWRWRYHFQIDQLRECISLIRKDPKDRRIVMNMWDPQTDLGKGGLDRPCNLNVMFRVVNGRLNMTVTNRSNDVLYGMLGANAHHFSVVHQYVAAMSGIPIGSYYQFSNNLHAYIETEIWHRCKNLDSEYDHRENPYNNGSVDTYPLVSTNYNGSFHPWNLDLTYFFSHGERWRDTLQYTDPFFPMVAVPLRLAYIHWKNKDDPNRYSNAKKAAEMCAADDWRYATLKWLERREQKFLSSSKS